MKQKANLKKKIVPSLLTVSILCALYSTDALALSINGKHEADLGLEPVDGYYVIDGDVLGGDGAGSHKFVIAQGDKVAIVKPGYVHQFISDIETKGIQQALTDHAVVGFIGGEGQLDDGLTGALDWIENPNIGDDFWANFIESAIKTIIPQEVNNLASKINNIDTTGKENTVVIEKENKGDTFIAIGDGECSPIVIGAISGDLSVNTGLAGNITVTGYSKNYNTKFNAESTSITRNGDAHMYVNSGNLFGGIGGSAAVSVGNIDVDASVSKFGIDATIDLSLSGDTSATLNGNSSTYINGTANAAGVFNGGMAMAIGGTATSTINGNSTIVINSSEEDVNLYRPTNGITAGISGGGAAITTIGGTAASTVNGSTNISVNNGFSVGLIGGGVAGAFDATGAVEAVSDKLPDDIFSDIGDQIGKNDGSSDTTIKNIITVTVNDAIQGGTATANTKDTNITLTGNTTAIGVIGGGVAAASHTYTVRPENKGGSLPEGYEVNDAFGNSSATSSSGKATITVNLDSKEPDKVAENIGSALSNIISAVKDGNLGNIENLDSIVGQGAAVGIFGGGVAFGHGSLRGTIKDTDPQGAFATVSNDGADINLLKGYAAGVFGGGAAGTLNNARAQTSTGTVNTYIGQEMNTVGVFGGGFALSMEGDKAVDNKSHTAEILAKSSVDYSNITIDGNVDGVYGGGMAIGNSVRKPEASADNKIDAQTHVGSSSITVNSGTIEQLQLISIMNASKNDNEDGYPQWNRLGLNASMTMVDLKGITDKTSIAAGGMALGMSGSDIVDTATITINGGTITKDILGGGIAVDNLTKGSGAHVGESNITLNGGTVEGSIYAGGAINGTTPQKVDEVYTADDIDIGYGTSATSSTVNKAVITLNGATVKGEISGQGYSLATVYGQDNNFNPYYNGNSVDYTKTSYESVNNSTLILSGTNTLEALKADGDYISQSKIHDFDNITVKAGSVTKLSGLTAGRDVALIDAQDTDVVVEDGAKLDLAGIEPVDSDAKYLIASNTDDKDNFWNNDALVYDRTESYANAVNAERNYNITYKQLSALTEKEQQNATNELVDTLGPSAGSIRALAEEVITNGDNINKGAKNFFKDTTSQGQNLSSAMMLIGEAAGVTSNTIAIAGNMADNSVLRLSFTQDDVTGDPRVNENGAVWVKYFHNSRDLDGVDTSLGSFDSDSDFDGVTVGLDIMQYNNMQAGIAFSYGKGDSDGMGIENDFDMWGVNLYGNYKTDYLNFIADIGYSESDNELDGQVLGKKVEADRDVSVITAGLRAETIYTLNNVQFVPYTGIRYYNINPDDYTSKYDGQNAFKYDSDRLNVWTLPLGTSVRGEFAFDNGLKITPQAEVAYIFAFGDTDDNDVDVSMGTAAASSLKYSVMDDGSFLGNLGLEIGYNSFNFGLGYSYQKGSDAEANNWYVNAEYSF